MGGMVTAKDMQANIEHIMARVKAGEEIVVAEEGKPVAKLVPVEEKPRIPPAGLFAGKIKMSEDFNEPLPDEYYGL